MSVTCVGDHEEIPERNEGSAWNDDAMEDREDNKYLLHITCVPDTHDSM